jgi:DNA-damage-inducible protein J
VVFAMANTTNLNIRIDEKLKRDAEAIFSELGLNMSTALNLFLRYSVRYGGIPFELRIDKPNKTTIDAIEDVKHNRNMSNSFDTIDALIDDLNA